MSEKELVQAEEVVASTVEETAEAPVAEAEVVAAVEAGEAEVVAESVAAEAVAEESAVVAEVTEVAEAVETAEVTEVVEATEVIEAAPVAEAVEIAEVTEVVEAAPVAEVTEAVEAAPVAEGEGDDEDGPVVKLLSVGQPIQGTVKRITEFGAFVDIGVGRDGLVHISELSTTRIAKVNDVLSEGQALTFWIKKLDRDRNRISLTLIEPGQRTIRDLQVGEVVEGTVTRILPYGAFIDIGVGREIATTAMGRAYLAALTERERAGVLKELKSRNERRWPVLKRTIDEAISAYLRLGYTVSAGEWMSEYNAVGVPLRLVDGTVLAFNCGGASTRISAKQLPELGERLADMVGKLERLQEVAP